MKNKDCKIVQDLLPNYIENLTTDETNEFVNKHIDECEECRKVLEILKEKDIEPKEDNKREIDYAKKVKRKLNILKFFLIAVIIVILICILSRVRNFCILKKLDSLGSEYENSLNFSCRFSFINGSDNVGTSKVIRKDNIITSKVMSFMTGSLDIINYSTSYNDLENNDFIYINSYEIKDINEKNETYSNTQIFNDYKPTIYSKYFETYEVSLLDLVLKSKISEEFFDGSKCYVIEYENVKFYFEKDTGILREKSESAYTETYYYEFNCVNDEMIEKPDVTGIKPAEINDDF